MYKSKKNAIFTCDKLQKNDERKFLKLENKISIYDFEDSILLRYFQFLPKWSVESIQWNYGRLFYRYQTDSKIYMEKQKI